MTDKPISFSGPMVRALMQGRKTQTRRMINPQPEVTPTGLVHVRNRYGGVFINPETESVSKEAADYMPYAVGDRLYVREGWRVAQKYDGHSPVSSKKGQPILEPRTMTVIFEAGGCMSNDITGLWEHSPHKATFLWQGKYRQAMHMPRWASRLWLGVTEVRIQRLMDISEADCIAEGLQVLTEGDADGDGRPVLHTYYRGSDKLEWLQDPAEAYFHLLDSLHGDGFSDRNPWLVAYSFTVHMGNIDAEAA